jgi:hypothetical protein
MRSYLLFLGPTALSVGSILFFAGCGGDVIMSESSGSPARRTSGATSPMACAAATTPAECASLARRRATTIAPASAGVMGRSIAMSAGRSPWALISATS